MNRTTVVGATMAVLLAANLAQASVCQIVNGSFEDDAAIGNIAVKDPNGWTSNVPADNFGGYVGSDWRTDGSYNLTLYAEFWPTFAPGDVATVSQQLYLADVNEIRFDLKLDTTFSPWDPNKCVAVLLIDDDLVWQSNRVGTDVRGEYLDQAYAVGQRYKTPGLHKLSLGIRVNVAEQLWDRHITHWDSIKCTFYCGGGGLLAGDLNRDCYVDVEDLKLVADTWLDEIDPYDWHNLFRGDDVQGYGTINFLDFAAYASIWNGNISDLSVLAEKWLRPVDPGDGHNLFRGDDVQPIATINLRDFGIFADNWLGSSYIEAQNQ